jgi:hypothetical protein
MNEERTGKCLRQVEHIRGHCCSPVFIDSATSGEGTAHPSGAPEFTPGF